METRLFNNGDDEGIVLPPGFRFHPTDEELITHYLSRKVLESSFCTKAIGEADLNKVEPWDLPRIAKMGEREFYFFCMRDRKYPTGMRTNRATDAGYWKATGKDKEIFRGKILVGMKKTLVFYKGRAPKGEKTNWVMHEFRLEGQNNSPATAKNEWVICRIFLKSSDGKKVHISNMERMRRYENNSNLPPLIECSGYDQQTRPAPVDHIAYFSDPMKENKLQEEMVGNFKENKPREEMVCNFNNSFMFPKYSVSDPIAPFPIMPNLESWQYASGMGPDQFMMNLKAELTPEGETKTGFDLVSSGHEIGRMSDYLNISSGPVDIDCLWN